MKSSLIILLLFCVACNAINIKHVYVATDSNNDPVQTTLTMHTVPYYVSRGEKHDIYTVVNGGYVNFETPLGAPYSDVKINMNPAVNEECISVGSWFVEGEACSEYKDTTVEFWMITFKTDKINMDTNKIRLNRGCSKIYDFGQINVNTDYLSSEYSLLARSNKDGTKINLNFWSMSVVSMCRIKPGNDY